jgi:hypothetical protein
LLNPRNYDVLPISTPGNLAVPLATDNKVARRFWQYCDATEKDWSI